MSLCSATVPVLKQILLALSEVLKMVDARTKSNQTQPSHNRLFITI